MGAVVIYSGGMDSFTVLHAAIRQHGVGNVVAFSLDYGQRHRRELTAAKDVADEEGVEHIVHHDRGLRLLLSGSALTENIAVPHGHYAGENMKQTVVPNRNMIILSLAMAVAVARKHKEVWTGVHAGDHAIYPDCRPEFITAMNAVAAIANYEALHIVAPFLHSSKGRILRNGLDHGLDYSKTWTCYEGAQLACGKCGACVERLEAFEQNNATDPLEYVK